VKSGRTKVLFLPPIFKSKNNEKVYRNLRPFAGMHGRLPAEKSQQRQAEIQWKRCLLLADLVQFG
jgi:hypothetical protein